jgi:hypothetical protein
MAHYRMDPVAALTRVVAWNGDGQHWGGYSVIRQHVEHHVGVGANSMMIDAWVESNEILHYQVTVVGRGEKIDVIRSSLLNLFSGVGHLLGRDGSRQEGWGVM